MARDAVMGRADDVEPVQNAKIRRRRDGEKRYFSGTFFVLLAICSCLRLLIKRREVR